MSANIGPAPCPKFLFRGTAFCFFLAWISGAEAARAFITLTPALGSAGSIALALAAGLGIATLFTRMTALLAARILFVFVRAQEMLATPSASATRVLFSVAALGVFSLAVHCVRHRHLFLEMTNLRELLDERIDPARQRAIGNVAVDS